MFKSLPASLRTVTLPPFLDVDQLTDLGYQILGADCDARTRDRGQGQVVRHPIYETVGKLSYNQEGYEFNGIYMDASLYIYAYIHTYS